MSIPLIDEKLLEEFIQYHRIKGTRESTIKGYVNRLKLIKGSPKKFFSDRTLKNRNNKLVSYRSYIDFLYDREDISHEDKERLFNQFPTKKFRKAYSSERKFAIPYEEWSNVIAQLGPPTIKMAVYIGFVFGLRIAEVTHLRVEDIHLEKRYLSIEPHPYIKDYQEEWNPKYINSIRKIPLGNSSYTILKNWLDNRDSTLPHPYLLYSIRDSNKPLAIRTLQRHLQKILYEDKPLHFHGLRYSFAVKHYQNGMKLLFLMRLLGHASIQTTQLYLAIKEEEILDETAQYMD